MKYLILFVQGILSFFYPCVLPMIPLYVSYLALGINKEDKNYQKRLFLNTMFFVFGIWTTFLTLSILFAFFGSAFINYKDYLIIIGGLVIFIFGLSQLEVLNIKSFSFNKLLKLNKLEKSNFLTSYILGLTISTSWTPCLGPALSTVMVLITAHGQIIQAIWQMFIYALGFTIPFILLGLFTDKILKLLKRNNKLIEYTKLISGIIIIVTGLYLVLSQVIVMYQRHNIGEVYNKVFITNENEVKLANNFGHKSIYFFLDSGCGQCRKEIPHINEYHKNHPDKKVVAIVRNNVIYPEDFIEELKVDTIYDENNELFLYFNASQTPSYILVDEEGKIIKNILGMFDEQTVKDIWG